MTTNRFPISRPVGRLAAILAFFFFAISAFPSMALESPGEEFGLGLGLWSQVERLWENALGSFDGIWSIWAEQGTMIDPSGVATPPPPPVSEQGTMIDPSGLR